MKRGTPDHPKTRALARALEVPLAQAVGTLEMLWQWTARFAPTGAVGRFGAPVIAESCAWTGNPDVLIAAMTAADSRFLDNDEVHGLIVHDWPDHADDMVHRQLARAGTLFANGAMPKLTRLSSEERKQAEAAFKKGARRAPKVRPRAPGVRPAVPGRAVAVPGLAKPEPAPVPPPRGNVRRPSPDSAEPTNGNGVPEDQREAYAGQVWAEFLRKSEQPTNRSMTPGEFAVLKGWMDSGIPLRIVLRAIADTRGKGRMLGYFVPSVNQAIESWRSAVPPAEAPAEEA